MNNEKNICLAVASSGIAATLLSLGRTFHSRFKAPLNTKKDMTLDIRPKGELAKLIKLSKMIVWDEAPMTHKFQLEALDRVFRDIANDDRPFAGKVIVLAGDFRQVLPVIPHGSRADILEASIKNSVLWNEFETLQLSQNMRVGLNPELQHFDDWQLQLGNGQI
ncbi:MAG: hypothetical protein GY696_15250, partial [Gammaproteobacteria bacterium]|nr:hypothetical protein [Gammaproteobacteria bacterium]